MPYVAAWCLRRRALGELGAPNVLSGVAQLGRAVPTDHYAVAACVSKVLLAAKTQSTHLPDGPQTKQLLLYFALLYFALLYFALLCSTLLCFALLCLALPCLALPCFALLCFAVAAALVVARAPRSWGPIPQRQGRQIQPVGRRAWMRDVFVRDMDVPY
ncbi:hypothetical protein, partial [Xanthomonas sp. fls2-241-TYG-148]|uniref:hypothetical protein n=1 Tax=Xanthomonas sp. fls2-241-TYG-148 TaxID=3040328 RepID=UPI0025557EB9